MTARLTAMLAACLIAAVSRADTDEAWLHRAEVPDTVRPLLALILDRSAQTGASAPVGADYDALRLYGSSLEEAVACDPGKAYFRRGTAPAPDCSQQAGIDIVPRDTGSGLHCEAARTALASSGFYVASRLAQWQAGPGGGYWTAPSATGNGALECRADRGSHGSHPGDWYAGDGDEPWTPDVASEIRWDRPPFADAYVLFSGNYLNYLQAAPAISDRPVADVMASRLAAALLATSDLEVALLRVDDDGPAGGFVARAPASNVVVAADVLAIRASSTSGAAPLAETLTEGVRWLAGGARRFGLDERTDPAALIAPGATNYRSPFSHACRPVSMAYLTAGEASGDDEAARAAEELPRFREETGGCGTSCLETLGSWLGGTDLRNDLPGLQSVPLSWVSHHVVAAGDSARSFADPLAYVDLVAAAHQRDAAVAADPQLSAAGLMPFDSRPGAPAVVFGLTAPRPRQRWAGNLLQYALDAPAGPLAPPRIVDRDGTPAIGADGLPLPSTRSLWSDQPDAQLLAGGAAARLPSADARRLYSDVAGNDLTDAANRIEPGNTRIGRVELGLGALDPESADEVIDAFRALPVLGDPGVGAPTVADYPRLGLRVVFSATHDGALHAFDGDSGIELWAWMPQELLGRMAPLVRDASTTARSHGIDGPLVLHRHDPDGDGHIDPAAGEHLWLMMGLGRGGPRYYAIDVAQPLEPRLLWRFELPDKALLTLAEPIIARLAIADAGQSEGGWVAVLAGGYDRRFDAPDASGPGRTVALSIVDAANGRLLWSAGGEDAELPVEGLASIAAAPRLLDLDGDADVDRAYVIDVLGDLWRIDFEGGRDADSLASASRLARLGARGRRFYFAPDASVVRVGAASLLAVAIGSGSYTRPRNESAEDALFVVYDSVAGPPRPEVALTELHDATDADDAVPPDARGWILRLEEHGAGEKVTGPVATFDHVLRFQTYQPLPADTAAPCGPPRSVARRYAIDVRTALPQSSAVESPEDEPEEMPASGLPPGLRFGFPGRWDEVCDGCLPRPFAIQGGETFDPGYSGDPVRTSWRKLRPPASP